MDSDYHAALIAGNALLILTFLLSLAFVVVYGFSRWWEYESGRNMMAFEFVIMLVTGFGLARIVFTDHHWFAWLRVGVFTLIPIILAWRLWMLVRVQYFTSLDDGDEKLRRYDRRHDRQDQA